MSRFSVSNLGTASQVLGMEIEQQPGYIKNTCARQLRAVGVREVRLS